MNNHPLVHRFLEPLLVLAATAPAITACMDCPAPVCTDHVQIWYQGTGPDASRMRLNVPYTATLEIHDSDGQTVRHEFTAGDGFVEPADLEFDRDIEFGKLNLIMSQPQERHAVARTVYLEIESQDWYGAQTFELDYNDIDDGCCSIASHFMIFQPKRDLP